PFVRLLRRNREQRRAAGSLEGLADLYRRGLDRRIPRTVFLAMGGLLCVGSATYQAIALSDPPPAGPYRLRPPPARGGQDPADRKPAAIVCFASTMRSRSASWRVW